VLAPVVAFVEHVLAFSDKVLGMVERTCTQFDGHHRSSLLDIALHLPHCTSGLNLYRRAGPKSINLRVFVVSGQGSAPTLGAAGEWRSGSAPALGLANAERCARWALTCRFGRRDGA
jgi:hypothetical protein